MALELFYTSVPRGLVPGSMGFCTVGYTAGMTSPTIQKLESLSGYRPIFPLGSPQAAKNPEEFAHWRPVIGGYPFSVLSRVRFAGADYSGRLNKFAHHLVLEMSEQVPAGPAWVMMQSGVMAGEWTGEPRILQAGKTIPAGSNPLRRCEAWERAAGDAGWAGVLAEAFLLDASKPAYVIYPLGTDILSLINEAIALLPERQRWNVTFSTYFTNVPANMTCTWRCCVEGTPAAKAAPGLATSGVVINLTATRHPPRDSLYVAMARTGEASADAAAMGGRRITAPASTGGGWQPAGGAFSPQADKAREEVRLRPEDAQAPAAAWPPQPPRRGYVESERRRPAGIFWAVAILWPLMVLAAGWLAWQKFGPGQAVPPVPAASPSAEQLAESTKAAKESLVKLVQQKTRADTLEKDLQTEKNKTIQERGRADKLAADLETAKARVKELEGTTVASATPVGTKPEDAPKTTPTSSGPAPAVSAGPAVAKPVPGIPNLYAAEYPKLTIDAMGQVTKSAPVNLVKNPQAAKIEVTWPVEPQGLPQGLKINDDQDNKVVLQRSSVNPLGKEEREMLAEAVVEGGAFRCGWGSFKPTTEVSPEFVENLVRYAMWRVKDAEGKELAKVQLVVPEQVSLKTSGPPQPLKNASDKCPCRLVLVPDSAGTWMAGNEKEGQFLEVKTANGVSATLSLQGGTGKAGKEIKATWSKGSDPKDINKSIGESEKDGTGLRSKRAAIETNIKNLEIDINKIDSNFEKNPEVNRARNALSDVDTKLKPIMSRLPHNKNNEIDQSKAGEKKFKQDFGEYERLNKKKGEIEAGLDAKHKKDLGEKPQELEDAKKQLAAKKGEIETSTNRLAALARQLEDTDKVGAFEVRLLTARSGVLLARITVSNSE